MNGSVGPAVSLGPRRLGQALRSPPVQSPLPVPGLTLPSAPADHQCAYVIPLSLLSSFHPLFTFPTMTGAPLQPSGSLDKVLETRHFLATFLPQEAKLYSFCSHPQLGFYFSGQISQNWMLIVPFSLLFLLFQELLAPSLTELILMEYLLHTRHSLELISRGSQGNPNEIGVCHLPLETVLCATVDQLTRCPKPGSWIPPSPIHCQPMGPDSLAGTLRRAGGHGGWWLGMEHGEWVLGDL